MKQGALYVNTDISSKMMELYEANVDKNSVEFEKLESWTEIEPEEDKKKVVLLKSNNEELPFSDGTFDSYISNFSLHLVDNHNNQLLEAKRVLKEGGIAGFTVWGSPDHCRNFTFLKLALKKLGYESEMNEELSNAFHLHDKERLRQDALDAGFKSVKIFTTSAAASYQSREAFFNSMVKHGYDAFCEKHSIKDSDKETLWQKVGDEYDKEFGQDTPDIIDFETNVLIAHK